MRARTRHASLLLGAPAAVALVVALGSAPGCYGATEISVAVTTTVACSPTTKINTQIFTGPTGTSDFGAAIADTSECGAAEPRIGTLSVVPSGARDDRFDLEVVGAVGNPPPDCSGATAGRNAAAPGVFVPSMTTGCVVARRRVSFRPHKSLTVPVLLSASCVGVPCGVDETCDLGVCTSVAECTDDGCPRELAQAAVDAGPDAQPPLDGAVDAPLDAPSDARADATVDGGTACTTTPSVVVDNQSIEGPLSMVGPDFVYANIAMGSTPEVRRVPRAGGAGTTVMTVAGLTAVTANNTAGVAFSAYDPASGHLTVTRVVGGTPTATLPVTASNGPLAMALAGTVVIGAATNAGTTHVFGATGTQLQFGTIPVPSRPLEILVGQSTEIYFVSPTNVLAHASVAATSTPSIIDSTSALPNLHPDIALAAGYLYFVIGSGGEAGIHRLGATASFANYNGTPWIPNALAETMTADGPSLYYIAAGRLYRASAPAGGTAVSSTMLTPVGMAAQSLTVDTSCVYWVEGGTRIMRVKK